MPNRVRSAAAEKASAAVDLSVQVGSITLPAPVLTASGTAGHGVELAPYGDLAALGAHVVKSLAAFEWKGNPSPRVAPVPFGMLNAVGLQGPGAAAWIRDDLPALNRLGVLPVVSIWGRSADDYAAAATALIGAIDRILAVEINLSCPNLEGRRGIFAHDAELSATVVGRCRDALGSLPLWAKLSPNTDRIVDVAGAVAEAGAESVTLVNTLLGMKVDIETGKFALGAGGGGFSGPAMHPVAVRAVHDVRAAHPDLPIVGAGGVHDATTAIELLMAGANAVQVGTATFFDPRAPWHVLHGIAEWCASHRIGRVADLTGRIHRR